MTAFRGTEWRAKDTKECVRNYIAQGQETMDACEDAQMHFACSRIELLESKVHDSSARSAGEVSKRNRCSSRLMRCEIDTEFLQEWFGQRSDRSSLCLKRFFTLMQSTSYSSLSHPSLPFCENFVLQISACMYGQMLHRSTLSTLLKVCFSSMGALEGVEALRKGTRWSGFVFDHFFPGVSKF